LDGAQQVRWRSVRDVRAEQLLGPAASKQHHATEYKSQRSVERPSDALLGRNVIGCADTSPGEVTARVGSRPLSSFAKPKVDDIDQVVAARAHAIE